VAKFQLDPNRLPKDSELRLTKEKDKDYRWSWEKRIAVVTKYIALGNMRLVSELEGVNYDTLLQWKNETEWWPNLVEEVKKAQRSETNTKLSKIVAKALNVIEDRIENGDIRVRVNKETGDIETERVPVSLKDATKAANDLLSQQIKMEEMTERVETNKTSMQDTLKMLAGEFQKWSLNQNKKSAETIEYKDITDAVHEEREEGLQTGSGSVHEQAGGSQEAN
jgi:hypothetical protein